MRLDRASWWSISTNFLCIVKLQRDRSTTKKKNNNNDGQLGLNTKLYFCKSHLLLKQQSQPNTDVLETLDSKKKRTRLRARELKNSHQSRLLRTCSFWRLEHTLDEQQTSIGSIEQTTKLVIHQFRLTCAPARSQMCSTRSLRSLYMIFIKRLQL